MPIIEKAKRLKYAKNLGAAGVLIHISPGIDKNSTAHTGDDQEHHDGQRIHQKAEINGQGVNMDPGQGLLQLGRRIGLEYLRKDQTAADKRSQNAGNGNEGAGCFTVQEKKCDKNARHQRRKKSYPD